MRRLHLGLAIAVLTGCATEPDPVPQPPAPDARLGAIAFGQECARCHASSDGFDLAFFRFTDTTIIRRAVAHVDSATARDIVAHIRSIRTAGAAELTRLFQPGGATVGGDLEFATTLFGRDAWPADLTTAGLLAIDPRQVRIAVSLPVWSDEATNLDWMPDEPLPPGILEHAGSQAAALVAGYRAAPTLENLRRAVASLRVADRSMSNAAAPCLLDDPARVNYRQCFDVRRWTSTLVAQHMLRQGTTANIGSDLHDVWWDVGNAARKSRADATRPIAMPVENWATWMFLGWSFDASRHPSVYTGGSFLQLGLPRHATFIALRSQVARPRNSPAVYDDLVQAVRFSPGGWAGAVGTFALRHLTERLAAGDRPQRAEQVTEAVDEVNRALADLNRKAPAAQRPALMALGQQVLAALSP